MVDLVDILGEETWHTDLFVRVVAEYNWAHHQWKEYESLCHYADLACSFILDKWRYYPDSNQDQGEECAFAGTFQSLLLTDDQADQYFVDNHCGKSLIDCKEHN